MQVQQNISTYNIILDSETSVAFRSFADRFNDIKSSFAFNSGESFNRVCRQLIRLCQDNVDMGKYPAPTFPQIVAQIETEAQQGQPVAIKTGWGGVLVKEHDDDTPWTRIGKYLAVRAGAYLAFEKHEQKKETLNVKEGAGLLIYRKEADPQLSLKIMAPGESISLNPGQEHCLLACQDLLVWETSHDPKGMDQDLIFIFM